jgi:hypothetical protein
MQPKQLATVERMAPFVLPPCREVRKIMPKATETEHLILERIRDLENELLATTKERAQALRYRLEKGKAHFDDWVVHEHRKLRRGLIGYVLHGRALALLTAPLIYAVFIPFALLDLFITIYQAICFPVYGVPKVRRADYLVFDRGRLAYLNLLEKINCLYCSYANGLCAYVAEIAARTEQHWCPIKHAQPIRTPHSRYRRFFDYGDAASYTGQVETLRRDFGDLRQPAPRHHQSS